MYKNCADLNVDIYNHEVLRGVLEEHVLEYELSHGVEPGVLIGVSSGTRTSFVWQHCNIRANIRIGLLQG